jgi:hypothetical protein
MNKRLILFVALFLVLVGALVLAWQRLPAPTAPAPEPTPIVVEPTPVPTSTTPIIPVPTSTAPILDGMICGEGNAICVSTALQNSLLQNPIVVTGTAQNIFENQFSWKVLDAHGENVAEGTVMSNAPDAGLRGAFSIRAFFPPRAASLTATGTLVLFEASARDGSPIYVLRVPVRLPTGLTATKIFGLTLGGAEQGDCGAVTAFPMKLVRTNTPIAVTLDALLKHSIEGSSIPSSIPPGVEVISLNVATGTATVVFNRALDEGIGGSCRVTSIRAQIEKTLMQFSSVKRVVISVQGKTPEETLQP